MKPARPIVHHYKLTNEEKETIITFDETPGKAVIYTHSPKWQKHLETRLGLVPTMVDGDGAKEYEIDKKRIRMPSIPRKLTNEQKQKLAAGLRKFMDRRDNP